MYEQHVTVEYSYSIAYYLIVCCLCTLLHVPLFPPLRLHERVCERTSRCNTSCYIGMLLLSLSCGVFCVHILAQQLRHYITAFAVHLCTCKSLCTLLDAMTYRSLYIYMCNTTPVEMIVCIICHRAESMAILHAGVVCLTHLLSVARMLLTSRYSSSYALQNAPITC